MTHSPEHMRQKAEARTMAEDHYRNSNVDGTKVKKMANEKPSPDNSVKPNMSHDRDGLGITRG